MNRRAFVARALGTLPVAVLGQEPEAPRLRRATVVRAGESQASEILQLGDRSFLRIKASTADTAGRTLIIEQDQLRRFGPPRHLHFDQDEWFYPLTGTFLIEVGDERFELQPGDFLWAPRGVPHVWMHVEEEPGSVLIGFEPAGKMESFFRRFTQGGKLPSQEDLPALFLEHGMKVVGPPLVDFPARQD